MDDRNVIIAGLPRSGTTLVCALLNALPDAVALNEPLHVTRLPTDRTEACHKITRFFAKAKDKIERKGYARSLQADGVVPSNNFSDVVNEDGMRESIVTMGRIRITKLVSSETLLCIKHPALFTALLDDLRDRHPCFAIVRNPLSAIASWNSVYAHVRNGHEPGAERFDAGLACKLAAIDDVADRQLALLSWHFARYRSLLPPQSVLRYEDLVASRGRGLSVIALSAARLDEPLVNRNYRYDPLLLRTLGRRLLDSEGAYWDFYPRESVEALLP